MNTVRVTVEQGTLEGEVKGSCMIFRGVPYAKAPVGELRFKAPQQPDAWSGVKEAKEFAPVCPQMMMKEGFYGKEFYTDPKYPAPEQSEDCLYLNIWAPENKIPEGYPVAFWIHGGAFDHGYSHEMEFDGIQYALRNTVLVTINYRVGIFGFMALDDLRREDTNRSVGNYGILDQIQALRWVRKNIDKFGGDPERITVFGQSAGALSVQTLVSSPLTRGMIHSAIIQSGGGYGSPLMKDLTPEAAYVTGRKIMDLLGVRYVRELRNLPAEKLVSVLPDVYKDAGGLVFSPVIDGWVLKEGWQECIDNDHIHDIPYMIGCTRNDISIEPGTEGRKSALFKGCTDFADMRIANSDEPVYVYYFARALPGDEAGAFHSSELWYMFGTLDRCWRPMERHDYTLSISMLDMWTDFMKKADPGRGWKAYTAENHFVRQLM